MYNCQINLKNSTIFKVKSDIYPQKKFIEKIEYLFVVDPLLFCVHQQKNIRRNFK